MLANGTNVRGYTVLSLITSGGMGEIYQGIDQMLGRKVAIKVINPHLAHDPTFSKRFIAEGQAQASLNHQNIVSLYAMIEEQGSYYMVMEYAEGVTVKDQIQKSGPIPEAKALNILSQSLEALHMAHSKGIIHRDIKPSNIMIDSNEHVKILDFGVAKLIGDQGLTATGQNVGTVIYMSPEQIRTPKLVDHRTDIYSLGVTLFQMLTARLPYETNTDSDFVLMNEVVNKFTPDPRNYYPHISQELVDILYKMLEKDPNHRYSNCLEVLDDIDRLSDNHVRLGMGKEPNLAYHGVQMKMPFNTEEPTRIASSSAVTDYDSTLVSGGQSGIHTPNSYQVPVGEIFEKSSAEDMGRVLKMQRVISMIAIGLMALANVSSGSNFVLYALMFAATFVTDERKALKMPVRILLGAIAVLLFYTRLVYVIRGGGPSFSIALSSIAICALGLAQIPRTFDPRPRAALLWTIVIGVVASFLTGPHWSNIFASDDSTQVGVALIMSLAVMVVSLLNIHRRDGFLIWEKVVVSVLSFFIFFNIFIYRYNARPTFISFILMIYAMSLPLVVWLKPGLVKLRLRILIPGIGLLLSGLLKWNSGGYRYEDDIISNRFGFLVLSTLSIIFALSVSPHEFIRVNWRRYLSALFIVISVIVLGSAEDIIALPLMVSIVMGSTLMVMLLIEKN